MKNKSQNPIITVIGCGMMGSSITWPAAYNGCKIRYVGSPLDGEIIAHARATGEHLTLKRKIPAGTEFYTVDEMDKALEGADLSICGVSSFGLDWYLDYVIPRLPDGVPVLSISKGMIHLGEGKMISYPERMEEVAAACGKKNIDFCAVGGPCTSYELADLDPSCVTFCGRKIELLREIRDLFEAPYYHVSLSTDVRGVECAVALKNFGQAVREMRILLGLCGGHPDNIELGAGDLYVTVFGGRTRKIGTLLGTGMSFKDAMEALKGVTLESIAIAGRTVEAAKTLESMGVIKADDLPLLYHIGRLLDNETGIDVPWKKFEKEVY